jgi:hypothetical protein
VFYSKFFRVNIPGSQFATQGNRSKAKSKKEKIGIFSFPGEIDMPACLLHQVYIID